MAAYGLARFRFKGRATLAYATLMLRTVLAPILREALLAKELDFLAGQLNPVIRQRATWLGEAAACLC